MWWWARRKTSPIDRSRSLRGVPVRNEGVTAEETGDGCLKLTVRIPRGTGFMARFQPPVMERNVELDELGSFVFRQIDGQRTAAEILDAFADRYRVARREAELSCIAFLKSLAGRRVISIAIR